MTRMRQFMCGSAALFAASLGHAGLALAQEPAAGQDIAGKTVWLLPDSRLRKQPGLNPFNVYLHARTALQMTGTGRCEPAADCPVRFDGQELWTRRTRLTLSPPGGLTFGSDGRPGGSGGSGGSTMATPAGATSPERWLRPGESGEEVRRLQESLSAKGFQVTPDGTYGATTEEAVRRFQRSAGLAPDGVAGQRVRDALAMSGGVAKAMDKVETKIDNLKDKIKEKIARFKEKIKGVARPGQQAAIYRTLRNGDSGEDVRLLQEILADQGFKVTVDGRFGDGTEEAVRQFQRRVGLNADGAVGPMTVEKLGA